MAKLPPVGLRLTAETRKFFDGLSLEQDRSLSYVLGKVLDDYATKHTTTPTRARIDLTPSLGVKKKPKL
jgi:hypothetical protein